MVSKEEIAAAYRVLQDKICNGLQIVDGKGSFSEELWNREEGGGGLSRVLQNGGIFEKGGVNFSAVHGNLPDVVKKSFNVEASEFFASGVSIVIHPNHPLVPIIHMNIRYFEMPGTNLRWFGGGIDLTPHYVFEDDARFFHQSLKKVCDDFSPEFYPKFKTWADNYFYIKHRNETRGIGGIFFDRLTPETTGLSWDKLLEFSLALGNSFLPIYQELIARNRDKQFTNTQKQWQLQRRSRYVEFNLVYDSGTKFGLETNGRIESILMSMPPQANWVYDFKPEAGSDEEKTLNYLKKDINWI